MRKPQTPRLTDHQFELLRLMYSVLWNRITLHRHDHLTLRSLVRRGLVIEVKASVPWYCVTNKGMVVLGQEAVLRGGVIEYVASDTRYVNSKQTTILS